MQIRGPNGGAIFYVFVRFFSIVLGGSKNMPRELWVMGGK